MSQKSILSFFKSPPKSAVSPSKTKEVENTKEKSPVAEKVSVKKESPVKVDKKSSPTKKVKPSPAKKEKSSPFRKSPSSANAKTSSPVKHEQSNGNPPQRTKIIIPLRKTARKSVNAQKKASQVNGHSAKPHKNGEEPVPTAKGANKRASHEMSDSDEDEVVTKPAKRRRNVISDDSPVKNTKTPVISSDDSDSDQEEMEAESLEEEEESEETSEISDATKSEEEEMDVSVTSQGSETEKKLEIKKEPTPVKESKPSISDFFKPRSKTNSPSKNDKPKTSTDSKSSKANDNEEYNPSKSNYHPIDDACWKREQPVPYLALARTLEEIESISARLKMIETLANFFRSVIVLTPTDLIYCVYLCLNRLAPEYEGIELGIGETILMKAVAQSTGRSVDKIKAEVVTKGDLGIVAESSRGSQRVMFAFPKLTVSSVFGKFKEIAQMSGNAAMSKKCDKIQALFSACRQSEARYIIRSLGGKLRIGLAEQSLLAALAQATLLTPPNQPYPPEVLNAGSKMSADSYKKKLEKQILTIKSTYCECPNYDLIIPILLKEDISELSKHCHLKPGIPLKPMLAHPTKGIDEVLHRFHDSEFTCEYKYDGERAQIHRSESGEIRVYSRNQENNTSKYPDVISRLPNALKEGTTSFILDTEAVAWDKETKQILPFQVLSTRKRKDAVQSEITVQVCIVAFDLIYFNGESLVTKPLKERRSLLRESFIEVENEFMFVHALDGNSADTMQEFLEESIKGKCEGLMVKSLSDFATYEIAKRSHNWLKLKKDYLDGVGDTLDLAVLGGWYGKGKRTGTFGGYLLACYDDETEEFQTICKIGTGFKDEDLEAHNKFFKDHIITAPKSYFRYDSGIEPDVWFEPAQVWEVKCADLSISPVHKAAAGIVDPEKGISLRFPRFLKIRKDKKPEDSTTASQVASMYNNQEQVKNQTKSATVEDEDFY